MGPVLKPPAARCGTCHERIMRVGEQSETFVRGLRIIDSVLLLRCRCGTWNPAPPLLLDRLKMILIPEG